MNKKTLFALTAIVAVAVSALAVSLSSAGTKSGQTLTFTARDEPGNFALDDLGPKSKDGPGVGDVLAFTQTLISGGRTAGAIHVGAIGVENQAHLAQANGTVVLKGGTIDVAGIVPQSPSFSLTVVGGTGTFAGMHGVLTVTTPAHTSRITITLEP